VGPADLSASYGKPGSSDDPEIQRAIDRVIEVCEAHGVIPGIHTSSVDKARFWVAKGMKMIGFCTDIKLIQQICKASVEELRAAL
jgi:4-hydroxy-2-oxoheptanedioate aldolase